MSERTINQDFLRTYGKNYIKAFIFPYVHMVEITSLNEGFRPRGFHIHSSKDIPILVVINPDEYGKEVIVPAKDAGLNEDNLWLLFTSIDVNLLRLSQPVLKKALELADRYPFLMEPRVR